MSRVLQLKISLMGIRPPIWRRILVEDSISFHKLHNIIQKTMGWENYHLYNFNIGKTSIEPDEDGNLYVDSMWTTFQPKRKTVSANNIVLSNLIKQEKQKFNYIYDFGDNWEHAIIVEKIIEKNSSKKYPSCISGERACPPEDCGGIYGYEELLEIQKDKSHPEYEERIIDWLGEDFDPEEFNVNEISENLSRLK